MDMSPAAHKTMASLLKRLESSSGGGKLKGPVAVAYRHRLAIVVLAIVEGGVQGAGSEGAGPTDQTADAVGDLIDMLTGQQEAAAAGPEKNDSPSKGQPVTAQECSSIYARYQAAVAAKNYIQANGLLVTYKNCLKGVDDTKGKGRLQTRARP